MSANTSILIDNVSKSFGKTNALKNISCNINENELFGFIGPDGAGKTTLFRLITTLLVPTNGTVTVDGLDTVQEFKKLRQMLGYMPGRFSLYQDLSVEENLSFFATIFGTTIEKNYDLIKDIYQHIEPFKTRKAGALSGGMKQKLALSCALIHRPKVLVLDEPTTGVDAVSRKEFWQMLRSIKEQGITIVVSTPYMDEASLCDRVALMQNGSIMTIETPQEVVNHFGEDLWALRANDMYKLMNDLNSSRLCNSVFLFGQYVHITLIPGISSDIVLKEVEKAGHTDIEMHLATPCIEDCFMKLMKLS